MAACVWAEASAAVRGMSLGQSSFALPQLHHTVFTHSGFHHGVHAVVAAGSGASITTAPQREHHHIACDCPLRHSSRSDRPSVSGDCMRRYTTQRTLGSAGLPVTLVVSPAWQHRSRPQPCRLVALAQSAVHLRWRCLWCVYAWRTLAQAGECGHTQAQTQELGRSTLCYVPAPAHGY